MLKWFLRIAVALTPIVGNAGELAVGNAACMDLKAAQGQSPVAIGNAALGCFQDADLDRGLALYAYLIVLEEYDEERMERHLEGKNVTDWVADGIRDIASEQGWNETIGGRADALRQDIKWMRGICAQVAGFGPPGNWPDYLEGVGDAPKHIRRHPFLWIEIVNDELECDELGN